MGGRRRCEHRPRQARRIRPGPPSGPREQTRRRHPARHNRRCCIRVLRQGGRDPVRQRRHRWRGRADAAHYTFFGDMEPQRACPCSGRSSWRSGGSGSAALRILMVLQRRHLMSSRPVNDRASILNSKARHCAQRTLSTFPFVPTHASPQAPSTAGGIAISCLSRRGDLTAKLRPRGDGRFSARNSRLVGFRQAARRSPRTAARPPR